MTISILTIVVDNENADGDTSPISSALSNLEYDKYLHGAGLHKHPKYGRLNIHLDYEKHPISGKERRLNIILFILCLLNNIIFKQNENVLLSVDLRE